MVLYLFSLLILSFLFEEDQWMILKMKYVVTIEFAKRGLIHASNFVTLKRHNFICK